jgi:hypothetical protein
MIGTHIIPTLHETLQRLALAFTVHDIMVPERDLVHGYDEHSAGALLDKYGYDLIPIAFGGRLVSYVQRDDSMRPITLDDTISDSTPILDLVSLLAERSFWFVLVGGQVKGLVTRADLNKHVVRVPFFVLLAETERTLADRLRPLVNADNLGRVLAPNRIAEVTEAMGGMKDKGLDLSWADLLYLQELLKFACEFDLVCLNEQQFQTLVDIRHAACQDTSHPLVQAPDDVRRLSEARDLCESILYGQEIQLD